MTADSQPAVDPNLWEQRRYSHPQETIEALIAQTTRQGSAIHELNQRIAELTAKPAGQTPPSLFGDADMPF